MTPTSRFALRMALALLAAVGATAAAHVWLSARDAKAQQRAAASPAALPPLPALPPLAPVAGLVVLAASADAVPDAAPVVVVAGDGALWVVRAAPPPVVPLPPATLTPPPTPTPPIGLRPRAAIVLPTASLRALTPAARGAVVHALGQFVRERPVPSSRVAFAGVEASPADLSALLAWLP